MRRAPVTVGLVASLWIIAGATGSVLTGPSPHLREMVGVGSRSLDTGRWWSVLSSGLWCAGLVSYVVTTLLLLVLVAPAETRIGSARTAALLVVTQVLAAGAGIGLVMLVSPAAQSWSGRLAADVAVGASTAAVGVALAASARLGALWRRRLRVVLVVALVMLALYSGSLQDVLRLLGGLTGLALGPAVLGQPIRRASLAVSAVESRTLVALVVAASALGPLVAALSGTAIGPLAVLRFLVLDQPPDLVTVQAICADPATADDCLSLRFRLRVDGVGPAIMSVLPALLLLVLADGLRRGRRFAWWGALGLNALFVGLGALLAITAASTPAERLVALGGASDAQFYAGAVASALQPLAVAALLIATQARYRIGAPRGTYRSWAAILGVTFAATATVFLLGAHLNRDGFTPAPSWPVLLADLPTRFLPPGYLGELEITFLPITPLTSALYNWTGVTFWAVAIGASLWVLRRTDVRGGDAQVARELLIGHGGSTLSWLTTWAGNSYWFDTDHRAAIAYRVIGRVALTTGEPFGDNDARADAVAGFARFCAEQAWTPCLYSIGEHTLTDTEVLGWHSVQVAEEIVVPLPGLAFTGKKWQDVRTAINNAAKAEVTAEWISYTRAPLAIRDQIRAISEEWIADKGLPEMGFTLGGLDELADEQVRCLVATDADRTVHGITSWLPVYEQGKLIGWTLDFMRRRNSGFRGVMEFLIASAAVCFQQEGAQLVSLSGAPLARQDRGQPPDTLQRLLDSSGRVLEPIYGFRSLLAFKAKFQPEYRPLYMTYPDTAALPAIAAAIGRAYLPHLGPTHTIRLLRRLRRSGREPRSPSRGAPEYGENPPSSRVILG